MVAYHSHQVIEKCFKAIIVEMGKNIQRTHNLENLYGNVKDLLNFKIGLELLRELNETYISARYPSDLGLLPYGKATKEDADNITEFLENME